MTTTPAPITRVRIEVDRGEFTQVIGSSPSRAGPAGQPPTLTHMVKRSDLDAVIETVIVDAYGDDEQYTAFLTVLEEQARLPMSATLLGAPVTVTALAYPHEARGLTAECETPDGNGDVALADLTFPPDTETAWIHAAYRHYLGLRPFPADPRPDWTWPT